MSRLQFKCNRFTSEENCLALCKQALEQRKAPPSSESQISKKNTCWDLISFWCWFQVLIFLSFSQLGRLANSALATICKVLVRNSLTEHPAFSSWWHLGFRGAAYVGTSYSSQQLPQDELLGWAQLCNFIPCTLVSVPPTIATLYLVLTSESRPLLLALGNFILYTHVSLPLVSKCIHCQSPCGLNCCLIELSHRSTGGDTRLPS